MTIRYERSTEPACTIKETHISYWYAAKVSSLDNCLQTCPQNTLPSQFTLTGSSTISPPGKMIYWPVIKKWPEKKTSCREMALWIDTQVTLKAQCSLSLRRSICIYSFTLTCVRKLSQQGICEIHALPTSIVQVYSLFITVLLLVYIFTNDLEIHAICFHVL